MRCLSLRTIRQLPRTRWRRVMAGAATGALAVALGAGTARAAGSSPVLALTAVDAFADAAGARLVTAAGAFNFDDLVQISFPAAGLMVVQGTRFARYDVDGHVVEGSSPLVADGVDPTELSAVLALGSPAVAPAELSRVSRDEVAVVLPEDFVAGLAYAILFAEHDSESFVSNAINVVLP